MECDRCGTEMTLGTDDYYRCPCRNILHVTTAGMLSTLMAMEVDEIVAAATVHLAWARSQGRMPRPWTARPAALAHAGHG